MPFAFIIMQIGNKEMDAVCERAIVPAIEACGLEAKRVDKHNEGRLLNSEIARFITEADIVVADLTHERQNCYLEVGYTMGIGKYPRLVLSAREDHFHDSPNYQSIGPKIHFDLGGYDILQWKADDLEKYRKDLEKRIRGRLQTAQRSVRQDNDDEWPIDTWYVEQVARARPSSLESKCQGGMEIFIKSLSLTHFVRSFTQRQLKDAVTASVLSPFGMRVGMAPQEAKPQAMEDSVLAEFKGDHAYSYWAINRNGLFYQNLSLLEDSMTENRLSIDYQIMRTTEALLFAQRLLIKLGIDATETAVIQLRTWGLKNRLLTMSNPMAHLTARVSHANDSDASLQTPIREIENELLSHVKKLCDPTFTLFDFFEPKDSTYDKAIGDLRQQLNA